MADMMAFPKTVEEFMEQYKIVDTEEHYSNGMEFVPIFRMKQWFEHLPAADVRAVVRGEWEQDENSFEAIDWNVWSCSVCGEEFVLIEGTPYDNEYNFCPNCGADMRRANND